MSRQSTVLSLWLTILVIGILAGMLYSSIFRAGENLLVAAIYGVIICSAALGFERGLLFPGLQRRLKQWPSLPYIIVSELLLIVFIAIGNVIAGTLCWSLGMMRDTTWRDAAMLPFNALVFSLVIVAAFVFVTRMRDLLGAEVFRNLLLGRYHRPAEEERVFLFIDIAGSTAYAETHGDLKAQQYLAAIFATFAEPVRRHRGAIDDYIGDLAIITWPMERGLRNAACLNCLIDIRHQFARNADDWRQRFGRVPAFRAAFHGGSVVMAEVGVDRHKIAYFGDVVNTTARLETLSRTLDEDVLMSSDLLGRLPALPKGVNARPLGTHAIRGRDQMLAIAALDLTMDEATAAPQVMARQRMQPA